MLIHRLYIIFVVYDDFYYHNPFYFKHLHIYVSRDACEYIPSNLTLYLLSTSGLSKLYVIRRKPIASHCVQSMSVEFLIDMSIYMCVNVSITDFTETSIMKISDK